ncbi:hypothetical protein DPMN_113414 [Dreissena polymorpha]|uniref:Uncharacterized protein n=1 Tax=Dreissena polymorpha TaxID=45954 RepID=A0A9D4KI88_DREPO|nr:hypothetical protein DPMN_113414 [Dreissena polymorpha]
MGLKCSPETLRNVNILTSHWKEFHEKVLKRINFPPPDGTILEHIQDITKTNVLTKFHEDLTIKNTFRVLTSFYNSHIRKTAPSPGNHVFQPNVTIFKIFQDIIGTNLLTKIHKDKCIIAINLLTMIHDDQTLNVSLEKNSPSPSGHVFQQTRTIFKLVQDIIATNLLTKCHEDGTINMAFSVLTRFYYSHIRKNAPPPCGNVFQATRTILEIIQEIIGTNLLTKFHDDGTINVASRAYNEKCPAIWRPCFSSNRNHSFELIKFHLDWTINVASRVLKGKC